MQPNMEPILNKSNLATDKETQTLLWGTIGPIDETQTVLWLSDDGSGRGGGEVIRGWWGVWKRLIKKVEGKR